MTKIKVEADLSGLNAELEKIDRTAGEIVNTFGKIGKDVDFGTANKQLGNALKQAEALADVLGEKMESGLLSPRQMEQAAKSFEKIAAAAGKTTQNLKYGEKVPEWVSSVSREFTGAAKQAGIVERAQQNLAQQGRRRSAEEVREYERRTNELIRQEKRFSAFRGMTLDEITGGGWRNTSTNLRQAERLRDDLYKSSGIISPGRSFAGQTFSQVGHSVAQAIPGGNIIANAASAASATEGGGLATLATFGRFGSQGLAAFAAYKAVSGIMDKVGGAQQQAMSIGDLNHSIQGSAAEFDRLRESVFQAGKEFSATNEETTQLASVFAKTTGRLDMADVSQAGGFARANGLNPAQSAQFFASMRMSGVTRNDADSKRLALYIGEAVGRSGAPGKLEEFMAVAGSFIQHTAQFSYSAPNSEAYLNLLGSMTERNAGVGLAGNPMNAGAMIAKADAAARQGGTSEASHLFWLGALQGRGVNAFDLPYQLEGGLMGSAKESFGHDSGIYKMAQPLGDRGQMAHLDDLVKRGGSGTNLDALMQFAEAKAGHSAIAMGEALHGTLNLSARESTVFYNRYKAMGGSVGISKRLKEAGLDVDINSDPAVLAKALGLIGGDRKDLESQAKHLQTLPGVSKDIKEALAHSDAMSDEELKKVVLEQTRLHDEFKSQGDLQRDAQNRMDASLQKLAADLIPATIKGSEAIVWIAEKLGRPKEGVPSIGDAIGNAVYRSNPLFYAAGKGAELVGDSAKWAANKFTHWAKFGNTDKYSDLFNDAGRRTGVDPALIQAVASAESRGNPNAVSNKGAGGVMQLMPGTAARFGVGNRFDPNQSIQGGAKYLQFLLGKYHGDSALAVAAYNAGEGNVDKYGGVPPFAETRAYTAKVMALYHTLKEQPEENLKLPVSALSPMFENPKPQIFEFNHNILLMDEKGQMRGKTSFKEDFSAPIPVGY